MAFYKYSDNPTIYGAENKAFATPDDFFAAGGAKDFGNVQTLSGSAPTIIQPAQTTGAAPLDLPQPDSTGSMDLANASVAGAAMGSAEYQANLAKVTPPTTALDTQNQKMVDELSSLYGQDVGKSQAQATGEQQAGIPDMNKQLQDINGQIAVKNAEYEKLVDSQEGQGRGKVLGIVRGEQAQIRRMQASDIGILSARAQAMQGNIQVAQSMVDRAVNLKYAGIEENIVAKERQMALIQPLLDAQQKKQALALQLKLDDEKERIVEEKMRAKENITLALETGVTTRYANKRGEIYDVNSGVAYSTPADFFKAAGVKSFEEAYAREMIQDINPFNTMAERKFAYEKEAFKKELEFKKEQSSFDRGIKIAELEFKMSQKGETDPKVIAQVDKLASSFDSHPIVKQFNEVQNKMLSVEQIINNGVKGPADLALVFEFMKALDPTSVVREQEYANAAKSGNIFQGAMSRYNGYLKEGGGFLPENVRGEFANIIKQKYGVAEDQYDNLYNETARKINMKTGDEDGNEYLTNYKQATEKSSSQVLDDYIRTNPDKLDDVERIERENPEITDDDILKIFGVPFSSVGKTLASKGNTPYLKTLGAITGLNGSSLWKWGLDIDLKKGDPVKSPISGTVIGVSFNGGFGKQVKIRGNDGREYWLSHLDAFKVKQGQKITAGTIIGLGGNTGNTIALGGGDGSHLDLTVKQNGKYIPAPQVKKLLDNVFV